MKQFKWAKHRPNKGLSFPTSREGASLTYISRTHSIVLFGGISNGRMNDIMIYDIQKEEWRTQLTQGRQPSPRCYHTAFYDEKQNTIYFYGGQGDKARSMSDFYCLSLNNYVWKRLFLLEGPPNRHSHTMLDLPGQEKLIFGGACLPEDLLYNDVWIFNYASIQFTSQQEIPGALCTKKICKGEQPTPRAGHGAVIFENSLFVFGGKCSDAQTTIFKLYFESYQWKKLLHFGKAPSPRAYFSTHLVGENVIMYGGQELAANKVLNETYILNLNDYHWSAPFTAGAIPSARYNHFSCLIGDTLLIMGGIDQTYCSMDMFFLSEGAINQDAEWELIKEPTAAEKETMDQANAMVMDGKMYLQKIEDAMMRERQLMSELQKDVKHLQEEADNLDESIKNQRNQCQQEHSLAVQNNKNKEIAIETIFLMIKQEQMLAKQLQHKNELLEDCISKQYFLLTTLDLFYNSIRKIQGSDPQDMKIKKIAEQYSTDINKAREAQIDSLARLKQAYEQYMRCDLRNQNDLTEQRFSVKNINTDFEQLIFETEHE